MSDNTLPLFAQIVVLKSAIIDHIVNFVDKVELIPLQLIACEPLDNIILRDELEDSFLHICIALNIVRTAQRPISMHLPESLDELTKSVLHRREEESKRRAVFPAWQLKQLEDVLDVVLLVEQFVFFADTIYLKDLAHFRHMIDKLLH